MKVRHITVDAPPDWVATGWNGDEARKFPIIAEEWVELCSLKDVYDELYDRIEAIYRSHPGDNGTQVRWGLVTDATALVRGQ